MPNPSDTALSFQGESALRYTPYGSLPAIHKYTHPHQRAIHLILASNRGDPTMDIHHQLIILARGNTQTGRGNGISSPETERPVFQKDSIEENLPGIPYQFVPVAVPSLYYPATGNHNMIWILHEGSDRHAFIGFINNQNNSSCSSVWSAPSLSTVPPWVAMNSFTVGLAAPIAVNVGTFRFFIQR